MTTKELLAQLQASRESVKAYKEGRSAAAGAPAPTSQSSELKICARFGVKSINELVAVNTADRRFKAIPAEDREAVRSLKEAADVAVMCADRFKTPVKQTRAYDELVRPALKALGSTVVGHGDEWVPTMIAESYIDEYNLDRKVSGLFSEIRMPSNPYQYPVLSNGAIATILGEGSQKAAKDQFTTSAITFSAVKLSNQYELPEELQEDSAVDVMRVIRQELLEGQAKAEEIAILEGDTTALHQHTNTQIPGMSGTPAADSPERAFMGLRKRARAGSLTVDGGGAVASEALLSSLRQKLGKFGVNPSELALICGVRGYNELMDLDDVRTLEQYGSQATVLQGELAKINGIPVIVSEWLREDTDATGINGAVSGNNIKASMIMVNRKRFFCGLRRAVQVKVENYRTAFDTWDAVSFSRKAFEGVLKADGSNAAAESSVALLYNLA